MCGLEQQVCKASFALRERRQRQCIESRGSAVEMASQLLSERRGLRTRPPTSSSKDGDLSSKDLAKKPTWAAAERYSEFYATVTRRHGDLT